MMKPRKKRILLFSLAHLTFLVVFLVISFTGGMDEFDGKGEMSVFERLSGNIAEILMSPAYLLWNSWASKNVPDAIEMILFLMNSVLWGTAIEAIYTKWGRRQANE